ncbi:MAG: hypothetical protein PW735_09680 [Acidobacteriaceae bacterium]|nr:hypothetical protein [Acidobacteriaceae bacterium]
MKKNRLLARLFAGLLLAVASLSLTACSTVLYRIPENNYSGRPVPPSNLLERVLVTYTTDGSTGGAQILDGLKNRRGNIQNTILNWPVKSFSAAYPSQIFNFPEEMRGYVLSQTDGVVSTIDYSTEAGLGALTTLGANPSPSVAPSGTRVLAGVQGGLIEVYDSGNTYALSLPNVYKTVINAGNTILLAMVRNSDSLYRVIKLPQSATPTAPPGAVDCQPINVPVFCVVPVKGTFDRPYDAYFSLNGNQVYVLNCGPECGGSTAGVSVLTPGSLHVDVIPTEDPISSSADSSMVTLPVANPIPVPGGVTIARQDSNNNLYLAGQQMQTSGTHAGLFAGNLSVLNLTTYTVGNPVSISDGTHNRILLADDSTLWVGATQCATGVRAATATEELASQGYTDQAGDYNCLTRVSLSGTTPSATIIPQVVQSNVSSVSAVTVGYPNTDQNEYYYGNLTGLCWVQNYNKVYTAYGGQVHAFNTADGSEIDNFYFTIPATALDVAYMDALTNAAN